MTGFHCHSVPLPQNHLRLFSLSLLGLTEAVLKKQSFKDESQVFPEKRASEQRGSWEDCTEITQNYDDLNIPKEKAFWRILLVFVVLGFF